MRILHVVTHLGLGGAERVAELLASASASRGHEVSLLPIVAARDHAYRDAMTARLTARGVRVRKGAASSTAKIAVVEGAGRLAQTVAAVRPTWSICIPNPGVRLGACQRAIARCPDRSGRPNGP